MRGCIVGIVFVTHVLYKVAFALTCLSCTDVTSPTDCKYVTTCGPHSVCFVNMYVTNTGKIRMELGCKDTAQCTNHRRRRLFVSNSTDQTLPGEVIISKSSTFEANLTERILMNKLHIQRRDDKLFLTQCCNSSDLCNAKPPNYPGYPPDRGPICFACDQQTDLSGCHEIRVCGRDDACFVEEFTLAGMKLYRSSCMSLSKCKFEKILLTTATTASNSAAPVLIGRSANMTLLDANKYSTNEEQNKANNRKRYITANRACCDSDMCNTNLPQNGNWGPWTSWESCSTSCGYNGSRKRWRRCEYPPPALGGLPCKGNNVETDTTCANRPCDQGMLCLSCKGSILPRTCNFIDTCGPHSVCFLESYISPSGEVRYSSGCRDRNQCANGIHKRFMVNGDLLACSDCCIGDLCNSHGCGEARYVNQGPVCFSCDQQPDPQTCNQINICSDEQKCGLIKLSIFDTVYQTMCLDASKCSSDISSTDIYPKCCSTSLCTIQMANKSSIPTPTRYSIATLPATAGATNHGFSTALVTTAATNQGSTTAPVTTGATNQGSTTALVTTGATNQGSATALVTIGATNHGFTTAPVTTGATNHGFTTASATLNTHTATTTNPNLGDWSDWSTWGPCLEPNPGVRGTRERTRTCNNPINTGSCQHGHTETDIERCSGGMNDACILPKITDITLQGQWEMNGLVVLTCIATGHPVPQIKWSTSLDSKDTSVALFNGDPATILIGPIEQRHLGTYICEASNKCSTHVDMRNYTVPVIH